MPIYRGPFDALVDDDGSGLTGTVWNKNAIKNVLLDPIDLLVGSRQVWTPTDASGAGLVLAVTMAQYVQIGPLVAAFAHFTYPATSNGAQAQIGGLPVVVAVSGGLYVAYGMPNTLYLAAGATNIYPLQPGNGTTFRTNAEMSGALCVWAGVYLTY